MFCIRSWRHTDPIKRGSVLQSNPYPPKLAKPPYQTSSRWPFDIERGTSLTRPQRCTPSFHCRWGRRTNIPLPVQSRKSGSRYTIWSMISAFLFSLPTLQKPAALNRLSDSASSERSIPVTQRKCKLPCRERGAFRISLVYDLER